MFFERIFHSVSGEFRQQALIALEALGPAAAPLRQLAEDMAVRTR